MTAHADPEPAGRSRVLTVPNALSVMRLLLIPVFVWLLLAKEADGRYVDG